MANAIKKTIFTASYSVVGTNTTLHFTKTYEDYIIVTDKTFVYPFELNKESGKEAAYVNSKVCKRSGNEVMVHYFHGNGVHSSAKNELTQRASQNDWQLVDEK